MKRRADGTGYRLKMARVTKLGWAGVEAAYEPRDTILCKHH